MAWLKFGVKSMSLSARHARLHNERNGQSHTWARQALKAQSL
jgi:hypothetical protein